MDAQTTNDNHPKTHRTMDDNKHNKQLPRNIYSFWKQKKSQPLVITIMTCGAETKKLAARPTNRIHVKDRLEQAVERPFFLTFAQMVFSSYDSYGSWKRKNNKKVVPPPW